MFQGLRLITHQLRPAALDELGLEESLQELVEQWQEYNPKTDCALGIDGIPKNLNDSINITIYRIVQESLTNVAKYAHADSVLIQLRQVSQTDDVDCLLLTIEDNGKGINLDKPTKGLGLAGMHERILLIGGEFILESSPGRGFHIKVQIPLTT